MPKIRDNYNFNMYDSFELCQILNIHITILIICLKMIMKIKIKT
jgi:hypothetical protein